MRLDDITPVILTYNEEANIGRTLAKLDWARDIVVVDSYSTDRTLEIIKDFPQVRLFMHVYESHSRKWNFAVHETGIRTEWVLGLDADLLVPADLRQEIAELAPDAATAGYEVSYRMCIHGRPLPRSIFPPRVLLFRRARISYRQDGHTERAVIDGSIGKLRCKVDHDDRKSISHWLAAQDRFAKLETAKLLTADIRELGLSDRVRRWRFLAPVAALLYCLFFKRLIFAGLPGWYYTYQRVVAEMLLSFYLIEERLSSDEPSCRD